MVERRPRRERNMDAKRERILAAAARLFAEHGFTQVTTREVSEAADVAAGTLFRYATTRADLLIMVYNVEFGAAIREGLAAAGIFTDSAEAVFALINPVLERSQERPRDALHYQRELLFGQEPMKHRDAGLQLVAELEEAVGAILLRSAGRDDELTRSAAQRASRLVFAGLHLALAEPSTHAHSEKTPATELRAQVEMVVRGFQDTIRLTPDLPASAVGLHRQGEKK